MQKLATVDRRKLEETIARTAKGHSGAAGGAIKSDAVRAVKHRNKALQRVRAMPCVGASIQ